MRKAAIYTDPNAKPMSKKFKYALWIGGIFFIVAFLYSQFIQFYFLSRYEKRYTAKEGIVIRAEESLNSPKVGNLALWSKIMVLRNEKSEWAETDQPVHGFILLKDLSTLHEMNMERVNRGLMPKAE